MEFVDFFSRVSEGRGRTLTELLTVLTILAISASMAGPSYRAMIARAQARSVAVEIASELRMARQLAMSRRERLLVRFDQSQQSLTFRRADFGDVLDVYRYADKGVKIEEPTAGPDVLFHPSGRSATATTIAILDREGKKTILTVSLTGRVTIS
jgi:type IV fimbrial biogenesis protein FimT